MNRRNLQTLFPAMSLTFTPFSNEPAVDKLAQDLRKNVPDSERLASGVFGLTLVTAATSRTGVARWALFLAGTAFLWRGVTGRCLGYDRMEIDRRHEASGVTGGHGIKVEHQIEIHRSPEVLFAWWRDLENLPRAMSHLVGVRQLSARRSHWQARAPFGQVVDWYAEIVHEEPGRVIAWQSLPGAAVRSAGAVRFEDNGAGGTHLHVNFAYDPPAGVLGAAVAALLGSSPQQEMVQDLAEFKRFAERELEPFLAVAV